MSYIPQIDKDTLIKDLQYITLVKIVKQILTLGFSGIALHLMFGINFISSIAISALTLYLYRILFDIYGLFTLKKEMNKLNIRSIDIDFNDEEK